MTRNTLQTLACWLRDIVKQGLRERAEMQASGRWNYGEDTTSLTAANYTLKAVARLLWKKSHHI